MVGADVPHQQVVVLAVQLLACELNTTATVQRNMHLDTYAAAATRRRLLPLLLLQLPLLLLAHLDAWEAHAVA
jgi:hypothetical protein